MSITTNPTPDLTAYPCRTWVELRGGQERLDRIAASRAADEAYRATPEYAAMRAELEAEVDTVLRRPVALLSYLSEGTLP